MKINHDMKRTIEKSTTEQKQVRQNGDSFGTVVKKQGEKLQFHQLNQMVSDIEKQGERLVRSRTFQDLVKYKTLVKKFVKEAVDFGMKLKQSRSWDHHGRGRTLAIVEEVDKQLISLTEEIMNKESDQIAIVGRIGEIKGLLINLYT